MRQPTLFIPHGGGPCFFMKWSPPDEWDALAAWLRAVPSLLPERPRALLVVSAHWEAPVPTVQTGTSPPLLFDYTGFPPHTYQLKWPSPGAPDIAARVRSLLADADIPSAEDDERGFDHGVFVPMLLSFPDADVPTFQLSLKAGLDPSFHLTLGRALAPLRDEGVLIVGSGMSYHNMRGFGNPLSKEDSERFDTWIAETVCQPAAERGTRLARWTNAPSARAVHPREEHLLPLMVCAGAAGDDPGRVAFSDVVMGVRVSAVQFG